MQEPPSPIDSPTSPTSPWTPLSPRCTPLPFRPPTTPRITKPRRSRSSRGIGKPSTLPRPTLAKAISHLRVPLVPLISLTTGTPHPSFPITLLQFHLLTHSQLDDLARFYHQVWPPVPETSRYPDMMKTWIRPVGAYQPEVSLETKRRRWGRFIGLRGCESPTKEKLEEIRSVIEGTGSIVMEVSLEEKMEREWRAALERARAEAERREKMWRW